MTTKLIYSAILALSLSTVAANATDPCDHYVMAGSFASKTNAVAWVRKVGPLAVKAKAIDWASRVGPQLTYSNRDVPVFTSGLWHVYFGALQIFEAAESAASKLRVQVPGAYAKHDCTGV